MTNIGVDCTFSANGTVRVYRIQVNEKWISVGQGRQWVDGYGRHILIMLPGDQVREIVFRPDTMIWHIEKGRGDVRLV